MANTAMDENYSEFARRAIFSARYEAHTHGASVVRPEHVILGLLRADRQLFELCAPELNADQIRGTVESRLSRRRTLDRKNVIPLSRATKRVLTFAKKESHSSGDAKIRTEHILAGLIRAERLHTLPLFRKRRWTHEVLSEVDVDPDQILQKIRAGEFHSRQDERATVALGPFKPSNESH